MKKDFPFYKSYRNGKRVNKTAQIEKKLLPKDKKIISDFLFYASINSKGKKRTDNRKRVMFQFCDFLEKPLSKIEDKDFYLFAETINRSKRTLHSKNAVREVVKRFGFWFAETTKKEFKSLKLIKFEVPNGSNKIKSPNDLITEEEFKKLLKATTNLMHKTLICLLWESAGRPEEILKSRYSDVDFTKKNIKLHSIKTKRTRIVPIDITINHLQRLKEESDVEDDDLIFTSQKQGKQLGNASFNFVIQNLAKKSGITKHISGYTFRHTKLTALIKTLSPKSYEMFSGHSLEMGMKTYAHLSVDDLTKEMEEKIFGIKKLTATEKEELKILKTQFEELSKSEKDKANIIVKVLNRLNKIEKNL